MTKKNKELWDQLEGVRFTLTEVAILQLLQDGEPHKTEEVKSCLPDDLAFLHGHLSNIRYKLRVSNSPFLVVNVWEGKASFYRLVKIVQN